MSHNHQRFHEHLRTLGAPARSRMLDHPFWTGLCDGSLPGAALVQFVLQDTSYLLPGYARALSRCASEVADDRHALLLMRCALATLESRDRLDEAFAASAPGMGLSLPSRRPPIAAATDAYCRLFAQSSARSVVAGLGSALPMIWFQLDLADSLLAQVRDGSRYLSWVRSYHPGPQYRYAVNAFLEMIDDLAQRGSAEEREVLTACFLTASQHEWRLADSALLAPGANGTSNARSV